MPVRLLPFLALLTSIGLLAEPARVVRAQQQPSSTPGLIIRFRPIDSLQVDIKYLIKAAGQDEAAKQVDELLKLYVKDKGIDAKKPLGIYGNIGAMGIDSSAVFLIPVSDEKAFLKMLDGFGLNVKNQGGLHTIQALVAGQDGYMRFANSYAYISNDQTSVSDVKKLLPTSAAFDPTDTAAVSLTLRLGQIPKNIKDLALDGLQKGLDQAKNQKPPDETETQAKLRIAGLNNIADQFKQVLNEGNELTVRIDIDSKAGEVSFETALTGQATSKLAKNIADVGASKSLFGAAIGSDSAANLLVTYTASDTLRKLMAPVIDEGIDKALKEEKKAENKVIAEKFLKVLTPTLKAGELDAALTLRGPDKADKYSLLFGVKVKDGPAIDKTLREIAKGLKEEEQARIKFDDQKIGTIAVHRLDIAKDVDAKAKALFGEGPLYVALRSDAAYFAFGENALGVLKDGLNAKPAVAPMVQFEMSLKRFVTVLAQDNPDVAKAAQTAFAQGKGNDKVRIVVEGGKALRARFSMKGDVVRFLVEAAKLKGALPGAE